LSKNTADEISQLNATTKDEKCKKIVNVKSISKENIKCANDENEIDGEFS
jgi:hypothetical protein